MKFLKYLGVLFLIVFAINGMAQAQSNWAHKPMKKTTTVTLGMEDSRASKTLRMFVPEIRQKLNINLIFTTGQFAQEFTRQYQMLLSQSGKFDIIVHWPCYAADYAPFLLPLEKIAPGGLSQVEKDLQMDDVHPAYKWAYYYGGNLLGTQVDGDVKMLHYRIDMANDPKEKAAFKAKYGYNLDMQNLTWAKYWDVAEFFTRPEKNFYGVAETNHFFAYFTFMDHYVTNGLHLFSYEKMQPLPDKAGTIKVIQSVIDSFKKYAPPAPRPLGFGAGTVAFAKEKSVFMIPAWPDFWRESNMEGSPVKGLVGLAVMPGFERNGKLIRRPDMHGGRIAMINRVSRNAEAAYKVLVFFSDKERTKKLVTGPTTWIDPWRKSHMDVELFAREYKIDRSLVKNYVETIEKSTSVGYPTLQIPGNGKYREIIERYAMRAFQGKISAEQAYSGMVRELSIATKQFGYEKQLANWKRYVDEVLKPLGLYE